MYSGLFHLAVKARKHNLLGQQLREILDDMFSDNARSGIISLSLDRRPR